MSNSLLIPTPGVFGVENNNNNNNHLVLDENDKIQEIWNKHTFRSEKVDQAFDLNDMKVRSWINDNLSIRQNEEKEVEKFEEQQQQQQDEEIDNKEGTNGSPSHHARRPMNAFLIFCKKHRPVVRDRFPNLENRGVTKILGEWWSLLEEKDKTPFTNLASEYKDAFLSANPDFKWYKLPAPPLRTLFVRPTNPIPQKLPSPQLSPSQNHLQIFNEFTPGKLADESQLGSITSLLNNNYSNKNVECCENGKESFSTEQCDTTQQSPVNLIKEAILPPKPIKKRIFEQYSSDNNTKEVSRDNLICNEVYNSYFQTEHQRNNKLIGDSLTNQDLVDKVVDNLFGEKNESDQEKTRKSGRQCKGKRYEKFMVEGKLLGNKKDNRLTQNKPTDIAREILFENKVPERKLEPPSTPNLENTIKRLAERTKMAPQSNDEDGVSLAVINSSGAEKDECFGSETSEPCPGAATFNLDQKIAHLPSLSYDAFVQKKRESKKRKLRRVTHSEYAKKEENVATLVGSKKRKNKRSITHLDKKPASFNDLLGLATLAEVAANTQKINET